MANFRKTHTNDTFTTSNGKTVRYEDIFVAIDEEVTRYGFKGGCGMSREDLDDLRQDAFRKAVVSKGSYDPEKSHDCPQAYGYKIAKRCEINAFQKLVKAMPTEDIETIFESCGEEYEADRRLESKENLSYIQDKISSLNESYRTVLELCIKGYKPKKMASILGCTPGAASSRLFKARAALAEALGADFMSQNGYKLRRPATTTADPETGRQFCFLSERFLLAAGIITYRERYYDHRQIHHQVLLLLCA